MSLAYEYISYRFDKNATEPINEKEYELIKNDLDSFLTQTIETFEQQTKQNSNPHKFNRKMFMIMVGVGILLFLLSYLFENLGYPNVAEVLSVLIIIPALYIIFQPIQYLMSSVGTESSRTGYVEELKVYYKFHHSKIENTKNYDEYVNIISETTEKDYLNFVISG